MYTAPGGTASIIVVLPSLQPVLGQELGAFDDQEAGNQAQDKIECGCFMPPEDRVIALGYENIGNNTQGEKDSEYDFGLCPHFVSTYLKMFCTDIRVKLSKLKNALGARPRIMDMMAVMTKGTVISGEASSLRVNLSELRKKARKTMGKK